MAGVLFLAAAMERKTYYVHTVIILLLPVFCLPLITRYYPTLFPYGFLMRCIHTYISKEFMVNNPTQ